MVVTGPATPPNFNRIARAYRWMEYATLGPWLMRVRLCWLGRVTASSNALILGDGDGRFTARLMLLNRQVGVQAVDSSAAMLRLLRQRCDSVEGSAARLHLLCQDARTDLPQDRFDLMATHFYLDCLTDDEVAEVAAQMRSRLLPDGTWLISEFRLPTGFLHLPARILVRGLYIAFKLLTGLQVTRLPAYERILVEGGFVLVEEKLFLAGLLTAQVWRTRCERTPVNRLAEI